MSIKLNWEITFLYGNKKEIKETFSKEIEAVNKKKNTSE